MLNLPISFSFSLVSQHEPTTLLQITITLKDDLRVNRPQLIFLSTLRPFEQRFLKTAIYGSCALSMVRNTCFIEFFTISRISRYRQQ